MIIETPAQAAGLLKSHDNILILMHGHPDGDTLGSGYSLCRALRAMGKKAEVCCSDPIPSKFDYLKRGLPGQEFDPEYIVAVDVADAKLLGQKNEELYKDKIDLSIDHHASNRLFAQTSLIDSAAAASEVVLLVIQALGQKVTPEIADGIYTGIATDTGCFRYSNVTPRTLRMAAEMIECGADYSKINTVMFETKTKTYAALERECLANMQMLFDDRCALITITQDIFKKTGSDETECDGIAALPRQVEGVIFGVTLREKPDGNFKVSVRTHAPADASELCSHMGGGGHVRAAGCQLDGPLENAKKILLNNIKEYLDSME